MNNPPLDSRKGMQMLADWARAHGAVLHEAHEDMAERHGVSLNGITISRPLPLK